jgi:hypothetical protein
MFRCAGALACENPTSALSLQGYNRVRCSREQIYMKRLAIITLLFAPSFALTMLTGTTAAQPAPFNESGVTMGHWHIASKDVEANKKLFLAMGGKLFMPGGNPLPQG